MDFGRGCEFSFSRELFWQSFNIVKAMPVTNPIVGLFNKQQLMVEHAATVAQAFTAGSGLYQSIQGVVML